MKHTVSVSKQKRKKRMAPDDKKIADVASPGKTMPSASGRPLLVTNRPVLTDPMVVATPGATVELPSGELPSAPIVNRTAKTISPVTEEGQAASRQAADSANATEASAPEEPTAGVSLEATPEETKPAKIVSTEEASAEKTVRDTASRVAQERADDVARDSEAEAVATETKEDAAEIARTAELERLIETGTYAVPINALQRKRSRTFVVSMCVLSVVLLLALADAALDANILNISVSVPHTHFFSGN